MDKGENFLELQWNGFISSLLAAKRSWERFSKAAEESRRKLEARGPKIQRAVDLFSRGRFETILPFFLSFCATQGGIKEFRIPKEQFVETKRKGEKKDG